MEFLAGPGGESKANIPHSSLENIESAVSRLHSYFGWEPHDRETENTRRALGIQVAALQRKLAAHDFYRGEAHGRFDTDTQQALMQFQAAQSLTQTGILDEATRKTLKDSPPYTFDEVHAAELDAIHKSREELEQGPEKIAAKSGNAVVRAHQARLLGLALSGGGIRSATFNLGILQTMARLKLLRRLDYLSTVSGGGYIGGWLHAWVKREDGDIRKVENKLNPQPGATVHEPKQVSWLRQYSNYLTPRIGLLSADTMAGVATWLRNVLLNQAILVTLGLAALCLPWILLMCMPWLRTGIASSFIGFVGSALLLGAIALGVVENKAIQSDTATARTPPPPTTPAPKRGKANLMIACAASGSVLLGLVLPLATHGSRDAS